VTRALAIALLALLAAPARSATLLDDLRERDAATRESIRTAVAIALADQPGLHVNETVALAPSLHVLVTMGRSPEDLDAIDAALDAWDDPRSDRLRRHVERSAPSRRATALLRDERHDRWAAAVNDTIRPFGLGTNLLAVVNPVLLAGAAIDSVLTAASHVRHLDRPSTREHEALAAFANATARAPDGRLGASGAESATRLDRRVRKHLCRRLRDVARDYLEASRLRAADYLIHSPNSEGCESTLDDVREDVGDAIRTLRTRREDAAWPISAPRLPRSDGEWAAYARVARALALREPPGILIATERLGVGWPSGPNARGAQLAVGTAELLDGRFDTARSTLDDLADDDDSTGKSAAALLATLPSADAAAVDSAERRHARDVASYVLLGTGPSTRGVVRTAAYAGAQGVSGLSTLGITNAIGLLTRAVLAWRRDPASNEAVIEDGERYLARHPTGRDADRVRKRLVRAYERSKRWDRALLHYQALPDPDPETVADFEDEIAQGMLERAAKDPRDPTLLRAVVSQFPASKAATKAREILAARDAGGGIPLSRDVLAEVPWLVGASGLGLPPGLLDGRGANGELDEAGVRITPDAIECTLRDDAGRLTTDAIPLDDHSRPRVLSTLSEIARVHRERHPDDDAEIGRWERWIPFFVEGTVGDTGVAVRPGVKLRPYEPKHADRFR